MCACVCVWRGGGRGLGCTWNDIHRADMIFIGLYVSSLHLLGGQ